MTGRKVVAICQTCVDYADEHAALYLLDGEYLHTVNDSARCPGQGDDDTEDTADPGPRRDGGGAGAVLLSVLAVLAVLALVVAPVLRELSDTVATVTTTGGTP